MTKLLFVHGTGVRAKSRDKTRDLIINGLANTPRSGYVVRASEWGDEAATEFNDALIEAITPGKAWKSALTHDEPETDDEMDAVIWDGLLKDPLFPLRLMAMKQSLHTDNAIGGEETISPATVIKKQVKKIAENEFEPPGEVTYKHLQEAALWLTSDWRLSLLSRAGSVADTPDNAQLVEATAQALVAYALGTNFDSMGSGPAALYDPDSRRELLFEVSKLLSDGEKAGIGEAIRGQVFSWGKSIGTYYGRRNRDTIMNFAGPAMGDILYTQRRGDKQTYSLIRKEIEALKDDVVIIAHSLGGVLAVDLLTEPDPPKQVVKLITVGSQPAFFGAADALKNVTLKNGSITLPTNFPQWLNIYDPADFLSFYASRFFSGTQIEDFEVNSGVAFPEAHGAYFRQARMYDRIATFLPA